MREVEYTDETGRRWLVGLPEDAPDSDAAMGVPLGPPPVADELGLPEEMAVRLHNELYRRRLLRLADVRRRPGDVQAALQAALKVDVAAIVNAYDVLARAGGAK